MPTSHSWFRVAGTGIAACLAVGCGAGVQVNDTAGRLPPPGTQVPAYVRAPVPSPGLPPDVGSGTATTRPAGSIGPGSSGASTAFCRDVGDIQKFIGRLLLPSTTAGDSAQARALLRQLLTDAPPELRPAITTLVQVEDRVIADLATNNVTDLTAALASPGYQQALQQVVLYGAQHCSITLTPPAP